MAFAVIKTGGKQYKVSEGDCVAVEKLPGVKEGDKVTFSEVLLFDDGKAVTVGNPTIKGMSIEGKLDGMGKGKKVVGVKFKNKTGYRRAIGHRQTKAKVSINKIKK